LDDTKLMLEPSLNSKEEFNCTDSESSNISTNTDKEQIMVSPIKLKIIFALDKLRKCVIY
jgi:hypothetical protein